MRFSIAVLGLALLSSPAFADPAHLGHGSDSCAQFSEAYIANPALADTAYFSWAEGFMSGMNMQTLLDKGEEVNATSRTMASEERTLKDYCDQHPADNFAEAVLSLYYTYKKTLSVSENSR